MPKVRDIILRGSGNQDNSCRELISEISFVAVQRRGSDKDMASVCINHQPCIPVVRCYSVLLVAGLYAEKRYVVCPFPFIPK